MGLPEINKKVTRFDQAARLEQLKSPDMVQKTKAVRHPGLKMDVWIFKVQSVTEVDGVYLCNKQTATGAFGTTEYEVMNLIENDTVDSYTPALALGDLVMAWESIDAAGATRLVGTPLTPSVRRCRTVQAAPNSKAIICNLYANDGETEITGADLGAGISVNCATTEGANLNAVLPRLKSEQDIFAENLSGQWWCKTVFQASENCTCTT